jgi:hypothetical protein
LPARFEDLHELAQGVEASGKAGVRIQLHQDFLDVADRETWSPEFRDAVNCAMSPVAVAAAMGAMASCFSVSVCWVFTLFSMAWTDSAEDAKEMHASAARAVIARPGLVLMA